MNRFAALYGALDETTKTNEKVAALAAYFGAVPAADAAWAVYFLTGGRPKRLLTGGKLATWATELAGIPEWLFGESYDAVGDLAETIALLLPAPAQHTELPLHVWVEQRLLPLHGQPEEVQREAMRAAWSELDTRGAFVWNKLITGAFRVGVSHSLVVRALAKASGVDEQTIAHRLMGHWQPSAQSFTALIGSDTSDADVSRPYPFYLAYPLESGLDTLGPAEDWQLEWTWDGIRAQVIRRAGQTFIWSRGEELVTERFPELADAAQHLPDGTVLDGEIMPWRDGEPLPFAQLQRRIGRKTLGAKILNEVPVVLITYDALEIAGADVREQSLAWRRARLDEILSITADTRLMPSPVVPATRWEDAERAHTEARGMSAEGLMLKRLDSAYRVGRRKGDWWKWKVAPYTVDAVLLYAQRGSGRRASLYTDYTFGVWHGDELVPFAKAYSGLTDAEIRRVDAWVRRNTTEKFGPVRSVKPELVFELAFEGIQLSSRHRSGIAVRFPRIARWREDKPAAEADSIETVKALI